MNARFSWPLEPRAWWNPLPVSCPTSNVSYETGSGFHHARGSNGHENRAFIQCAENPIQFERRFAEPADVGANPSAAFAPGNPGWRIIGARVVKRGSAARIAATLKKFPVHVDDLS